jgi:transposase InsO family protein
MAQPTTRRLPPSPSGFGAARLAGVQPSMGSVGDAYDPALCESFFATPGRGAAGRVRPS